MFAYSPLHSCVFSMKLFVDEIFISALAVLTCSVQMKVAYGETWWIGVAFLSLDTPMDTTGSWDWGATGYFWTWMALLTAQEWCYLTESCRISGAFLMVMYVSSGVK